MPAMPYALRYALQNPLCLAMPAMSRHGGHYYIMRHYYHHVLLYAHTQQHTTTHSTALLPLPHTGVHIGWCSTHRTQRYITDTRPTAMDIWCVVVRTRTYGAVRWNSSAYQRVVTGMPSNRSRHNYSAVYRLYGRVCAYCGGYADSIDHVTPWSYIPDNSVHNMVPACMRCNLRASNLWFPTFDAKRDYLRQTAPTVCETGITEESDDDDNDGELIMQDAIWEELPESDIEDIDDVSSYNEQAEYREIGLCGHITKRGMYCPIPIDECTFHNSLYTWL